MDTVELRHLRYFVAVAEELHFGHAAQRLHIAQPPLSQQIRQLEEAIGHPLLLRTSRSVKLTAAGEEFLKRAQQTLRKVDEDTQSVRRIGRGEIGTLTVGFVASAMLTSLPSMLSIYRNRFPEVELRLREVYTSRLLRSLHDGTIDIGFTRDAEIEDGLHIETLLPEPYIAIVPAMHPLAQKQSIRVSNLRLDSFVLFSSDVGRNAWEKVMRLCEQGGFRPKIVQEAPHWLTILRLVGAGLGVTIAPVSVQGIADNEVRCIPFRGTGIFSVLELAYRKETLTEPQKAFLVLAKDMLQEPLSSNNVQPRFKNIQRRQK